MKKTKIICTMGPGSNDKEVMRALIKSGMDIARFNFSHGSHEEHKGRMDQLKELREQEKKPIAILLDTKGPEIRTGQLKDGKKVMLKEGNAFTLSIEEKIGDETGVSITYAGLIDDVVVGSIILIENFLRKDGSFGKHAIMLLNIRDFGRINKRYGSLFGDGVLSNIGEKIQRCFRKKDIVCRVGGDDFLILIKDISGGEALQRKISQVREVLKNTFVGENLGLACDIGISCFPDDGNDYGTLFRNADIAMFVSSKSSESGNEIYDSTCKLDGYEKKGEYYHDYVIRERNKHSNICISK